MQVDLSRERTARREERKKKKKKKKIKKRECCRSIASLTVDGVGGPSVKARGCHPDAPRVCRYTDAEEVSKHGGREQQTAAGGPETSSVEPLPAQGSRGSGPNGKPFRASRAVPFSPGHPSVSLCLPPLPVSFHPSVFSSLLLSLLSLFSISPSSISISSRPARCPAPAPPRLGPAPASAPSST